MDRIMEQLSKLQELSDEELAELEDVALSEFETTQEAELSNDSVAAMTKLADAVEAVRTEKARRVTEAQSLKEEAAEAAARIKSAAEASESEPESDPEPESEPDTEAASSGDESANDEDEDEEDDEDEEEEPSFPPASTASVEDDKASTEAKSKAETAEASASGPETEEASVEKSTDSPTETAEAAAEQPAEAAASEASAEESKTEAAANTEASSKTETETVPQEDTVTADAAPQGTGELDIEPPAGRQPQIKPATTLSITAGADVPGYSAGAKLSDSNDVADAFMRRLHSLRHVHGGDGEQHIVASYRQEFPSDRALSANDPLENTDKIQGVTSTEAITAAAGVCLPLETRYELGCDVGVTNRPVRDALARFGSDRGGIRFFSAPTLADQGATAYSNATGFWRSDDGSTFATYNSDGTATTNPNEKPCLEVQCTTEAEAYIEAITLCLTFNNLTTRTFPELIKRHNELALVQHARIAENNLLAQIEAGSTQVTAGAQVVGATREIMNLLARAVAAYRFRHRMGNIAPLRMIAPSWVMELLRADLAMQMPGDGFDVLDMAEAKINAWFRSRGVNITWHLDGETGPSVTADTPDDPGTTATNEFVAGGFEFPSTIEFALFAEGTWLYLDGGTLDIGVIRDSSLVAANQYKEFVETFEGLANIGCESYWVSADYQPTGQAAALVDTLV